MRCQNCQTVNDSDALYCKRCGGHLPPLDPDEVYNVFARPIAAPIQGYYLLFDQTFTTKGEVLRAIAPLRLNNLIVLWLGSYVPMEVGDEVATSGQLNLLSWMAIDALDEGGYLAKKLDHGPKTIKVCNPELLRRSI